MRSGLKTHPRERDIKNNEDRYNWCYMELSQIQTGTHITKKQDKVVSKPGIHRYIEKELYELNGSIQSVFREDLCILHLYQYRIHAYQMHEIKTQKEKRSNIKVTQGGNNKRPISLHRTTTTLQLVPEQGFCSKYPLIH